MPGIAEVGFHRMRSSGLELFGRQCQGRESEFSRIEVDSRTVLCRKNEVKISLLMSVLKLTLIIKCPENSLATTPPPLRVLQRQSDTAQLMSTPFLWSPKGFCIFPCPVYYALEFFHPSLNRPITFIIYQSIIQPWNFCAVEAARSCRWEVYKRIPIDWNCPILRRLRRQLPFQQNRIHL